MKKIKLFVFALTASISFQLNAQLLPIQYDTLKRSQEIILFGGLDFSSSGLQNELTSKFIRGGMITNEIKDASLSKHKSINRVGAILYGDLEYRNYSTKLFKNRDWGMVLKTGYNVFGSALYSKDLFGLAMYGNSRYLGSTIDFSGLNIDYVTYQKIGFGFIDPKSKSNVSLNVYNISDFASAEVSKGEIEQDSLGEDINLLMQGEFTFRESSTFNQGIGLGVDFDFKIPFTFIGNRTAYFQMQAKNLGVGYLYEKQQVYTVDTVFNYSGFEFNQLVGDDAINFDSLDVLDTLGVNSSMENKTFILPGFIQLGKIVDQHSDKRIQSFFGIRLYTSLNYVPYVYAGAHFIANDWFSLGANISYGGFTNLRGGLYTSFNFDRVAIGLATEDVVGAVSRKGKGNSIYLRVKCAL